VREPEERKTGRKDKTELESQKYDPELLHLIVGEVDEARETLELVNQLQKELPIRRFDDIRRAVGPDGTIRFRGVAFPIRLFEDRIPKIVYPIEDVRALVERVVELVRMVPKFVANDPRNPENLKRQMGRSWFKPPNGLPQGAFFGRPLPVVPRGATIARVTGPGPEPERREEQ
jgi:hypothetical protein